MDAGGVDHPQEIVGENREAHLGGRVLQASGEEVALVRASLERAEGMLDEAHAAIELSGMRADPALHRLQGALIGRAGRTSSAGSGVQRGEARSRGSRALAKARMRVLRATGSR